MARFGNRSQQNLATCDQRLQDVFNEVIKHWDCSVIDGHRDEETQNRYYDEDRSKVWWPNSKHNSYPSRAADVVPYPIDWDDWERFYAFSGFVLGVASQMGINMKSGLDWDMDRDFNEHTFKDSPHFELVDD